MEQAHWMNVLIHFMQTRFFSAMYIEALKLGIDQKFYDAVKAGTLLFSDALPYMGSSI